LCLIFFFYFFKLVTVYFNIMNFAFLCKGSTEEQNYPKELS